MTDYCHGACYGCDTFNCDDFDRTPRPPQYTADENALIAETLGHLISLMEGLCERVTVDRLRALRTKAASLAFNEITGT